MLDVHPTKEFFKKKTNNLKLSCLAGGPPSHDGSSIFGI
jgi:hypothetical protein